MRNQIGQELRGIRRAKGIKQKNLAASVGMSQNALVNIEKGRNHPRPETIDKLCRALGVYFIDGRIVTNLGAHLSARTFEFAFALNGAAIALKELKMALMNELK